MKKEKLYFPNLNGLRCIAALMVFVPHIEQLKSMLGMDNYLGRIQTEFGHLGVVLFFVLSGFLITYLLLTEEKKTNTINIRFFYARRILKIWPLYFLIVCLGLFILPNFSFFTLPDFPKTVVWSHLVPKTILFVSMLPNLVLPLFGTVPYAALTWSIGSEEQFYLAWPLLLKFIKKRRLLLMLLVIIFYNVVNGLLSSQLLDFKYKAAISGFWNLFSIDCMAIGGIFAVLCFNNHKILGIIQHKITFYTTLVFTIVAMIVNFPFPFYPFQCYAVLFGILISNFANTKGLFISLEGKTFNYLGKITYGIYLYHPIAIVIALKTGLFIHLNTNYFFYPFAALLTIGIASLSYHYFEHQFLLKKRKFSMVESGK